MIPFLILIVTFYSAHSGIHVALGGALLAGIWYDLWQGNLLGETSVILLTVAFVVAVYKRKFNAERFPFMLLYSWAAVSVYLLIISGGDISFSLLAAWGMRVLAFVILMYPVRLMIAYVQRRRQPAIL